MKVYCFYSHECEGWCKEAEGHMISLWRTSWSRWGWDPIVLGMNQARAHPRFEELRVVAEAMPTYNTRSYCVVNLVRHCAIPNNGDLLVDYDILNNGWRPADFHAKPRGVRPGWYVAHGGYCGDNDWLIDQFINWCKPDIYRFVMVHGVPHISDMWIKDFLGVQKIEESAVWGAKNWHLKPLIHFAGGYCGGGVNKLRKMQHFAEMQEKMLEGTNP